MARPLLDAPFRPAQPARYIARECETVAQLLTTRARLDGHRIAYRRKHAGRWQATSWLELLERSKAFASYLIRAGVQPGDKVCIVGSTRPEWAIADLGGQLAGAVTLGAYPTLTTDQLAYILAHADVKIVVVEGAEDLAKVQAKRSELPKLQHVVMWDGDGTRDGSTVPWARCMDGAIDEDAVHDRVHGTKHDDTAIIVYTSGTTGPPKGAMISHANIMTVLRHQAEQAQFAADDVSFSFLPMAHVAERVLGFYGRIDSGITAYYATSIPKVLEEVKEARPTVFGSVPRIFEKAYAAIQNGVEAANPRRQKIFRYAERVGRQVVRHWQAGEPVPAKLRLQYKLVDKIVFSKIREAFGGRVRQFVTGAAPIAPEILEFFWACGMPIYEVYGMTEATVITHANRQGQVRLGSVGKALDYVEHRIAADGEILMAGGMVFQGYYKNPEATAETIVDGWLHTGDIGVIDDDGYLFIKDRKKHIIITAGGKNLTPANIENELKASDTLISQAHAHGDKRKFLVALVTVGPSEAVEWAAQNGHCARADADALLAAIRADPLSTPEGLPELMAKVTADPKLRERIVASVRRANGKLAKVETIKKVHLLERELSVAEDELTPTLKVKRKNVEKKFASIFDRLYAEDGFGLKTA